MAQGKTLENVLSRDNLSLQHRSCAMFMDSAKITPTFCDRRMLGEVLVWNLL